MYIGNNFFIKEKSVGHSVTPVGAKYGAYVCVKETGEKSEEGSPSGRVSFSHFHAIRIGRKVHLLYAQVKPSDLGTGFCLISRSIYLALCFFSQIEQKELSPYSQCDCPLL